MVPAAVAVVAAFLFPPLLPLPPFRGCLLGLRPSLPTPLPQATREAPEVVAQLSQAKPEEAREVLALLLHQT